MAILYTHCVKCDEEITIEAPAKDLQAKIGEDMVCVECQKNLNRKFWEWYIKG